MRHSSNLTWSEECPVPACTCGWSPGPALSLEAAIDDLMEHAFDAGYNEAHDKHFGITQ